MDHIELLKHISFHLSSVSHSTVGQEWNYKNITSPFSRLYLVTKGEALLYIGNKNIQLQEGYLYLVPSFTHCSYVCESEMTHYYATFSIHLPDNLSIYQLYNFNFETKANAEHLTLFRRLIEKNPNRELPAPNPAIYQQMSYKAWNNSIRDLKSEMISTGLLYLFISDFVGGTKMDLRDNGNQTILKVIRYIHTHLEQPLSIEKLAALSCLSTGHFTRKFKKQTSLAPLDYINKQRIEKAQLLLNTTTKTSVEIAEACGYKTNAYFCKIFKKRVGKSPGEYRSGSESGFSG